MKNRDRIEMLLLAVLWGASFLFMRVAAPELGPILYFRLISRVGPAKAITVTYLVPVFGMLWGLVFLHEAISTSMVVASALILLGTALATGNVALAARSRASLGASSHRAPCPSTDA